MLPEKKLYYHHILPINDEKPHSENINDGNCDCQCNPEQREIRVPANYGEEATVEGIMIIHHSFDGREGVEWVNEILNPRICYKTGDICPYNAICAKTAKMHNKLKI